MRYLHSGKRDRARELMQGSQGRRRARPAYEGPNTNIKFSFYHMLDDEFYRQALHYDRKDDDAVSDGEDCFFDGAFRH